MSKATTKKKTAVAPAVVVDVASHLEEDMVEPQKTPSNTHTYESAFSIVGALIDEALDKVLKIANKNAEIKRIEKFRLPFAVKHSTQAMWVSQEAKMLGHDSQTDDSVIAYKTEARQSPSDNRSGRINHGVVDPARRITFAS